MLDRETWRKLFALSGYTVDGRAAQRPRNVMRLYRGAQPEYRDGWSWTDNLDVARGFAEGTCARRLPHGKVWVADVEPWRMFCRIHEAGRFESEFVIDTDGLNTREYLVR